MHWYWRKRVQDPKKWHKTFALLPKMQRNRINGISIRECEFFWLMNVYRALCTRETCTLDSAMECPNKWHYKTQSQMTADALEGLDK